MGFKNFEKKIWKIVPGVKCHPGVIGASNATWGYWGVKCHLKVMGRQMPPHGIGASNTTWGCWGVKGHPKVIGASKARGVKGPNSLTASKIRGVKGPYMGKGRKGHKASEFRESKFGRQGSRRQRSRASKEMNPYLLDSCKPPQKFVVHRYWILNWPNTKYWLLLFVFYPMVNSVAPYQERI